MPTREKAKALILAGEVLVNDTPFSKAGEMVNEESEIRLRNQPQKYVSRGGDKLEGALSDLNVEASDRVCLDLGSSTGGFTDCLLQQGAKHVYCVDVGTNQLDHKIRVDPRVSVYEKTHAKDLSTLSLNPKPELAVIDVSFIGLSKVLPYVVEVVEKGAQILMLVKPQFELGPECITKGGVPLPGIDPYKAVEDLKAILPSLGLKFKSEIASQVKGKKSENQEYFVLVEVI